MLCNSCTDQSMNFLAIHNNIYVYIYHIMFIGKNNIKIL